MCRCFFSEYLMDKFILFVQFSLDMSFPGQSLYESIWPVSLSLIILLNIVN